MASYYELMMSLGVAPSPLPSAHSGVYVGGYPCPPRAVVPTATPCRRRILECSEEEIRDALHRFQTAYPELKISLHEEPDNPSPGLHHYLTIVRRLGCLYPAYTCIHDACSEQLFFLLLAHYLTTQDNSPGEYNSNTVASVSTGDSSISYNTAYSDSLVGNPFFLWLSRSQYGNSLLIYIKSQAGYPIIV